MPKDSESLLRLLTEKGCCLANGHFLLASGRHADTYIHVRVGLMYPDVLDCFSEELASRLMPEAPETLAAATVGGILLADAASSEMGIGPPIAGRRVARRTEWTLPPEPQIGSRPKVVLVDDVMTTEGPALEALRSLDDAGADPTGIAIALDRRNVRNPIELDGRDLPLHALIEHRLSSCAPGECPGCSSATPIVNLQDPEENLVSVIRSFKEPKQFAQTILDGYSRAATIQRDTEMVKRTRAWTEAIGTLLGEDRLPDSRILENAEFVVFVSRFLLAEAASDGYRKAVTDLLGHLMAVASMKVEDRRLACSVMVGPMDLLQSLIDTQPRFAPPTPIATGDLSRLIPYYDALPESEGAFLFTPDGVFQGLAKLVGDLGQGQRYGVDFLREKTLDQVVFGLVLHRGKRVIDAYREGKLVARASLSETAGRWTFSSVPPTLRTLPDSILRREVRVRTLARILDVAREMSTKGYGGIFVVGPECPNLDPGEPKLRLGHGATLLGTPTSSIAEIAKSDGAVFVSDVGLLMSAGVIIKNSFSARSEVSGRERETDLGGARRQTALWTSGQCSGSVVVFVSQNGTIELFHAGEAWQAAGPL